MEDLARRVWTVTGAAVVVFALFEIIKTLLFPALSITASHIMTVAVVGVLTFFLSRYALNRYSAATSEIERQTRMIEETNRLLSAVLETMREGVIIVDAEMNILLYNEAATRIVKLPVAQDLPRNGERLGQLASSSLQSESVSIRRAFASKCRLVDATRDPATNAAFRQALEEHQQVEARVEMADREGRSFQLNVSPLGRNLMVGVFFDITRLERLERVRREFFANLSHELRTPLTAILAYAETLLSGAIHDTENNQRFVEKLYKQAARMSELISDISDLSAIESGDVNLALGPVRLRSLVTDVIAITEARRGECGISFDVEIRADLYVLADRTRLEQILYNLIDNAVKFNRPGGSVTVLSEREGDRVTVHIEDTGLGIAPSDLPRVFERLYRADKSRSRKIDGTGLGLAIVKHLVQAHGGEVQATSEVGRGSRFTFTLPASQSPPPPGQESPDPALSTVE